MLYLRILSPFLACGMLLLAFEGQAQSFGDSPSKNSSEESENYSQSIVPKEKAPKEPFDVRDKDNKGYVLLANVRSQSAAKFFGESLKWGVSIGIQRFNGPLAFRVFSGSEVAMIAEDNDNMNLSVGVGHMAGRHIFHATIAPSLVNFSNETSPAQGSFIDDKNSFGPSAVSLSYGYRLTPHVGLGVKWNSRFYIQSDEYSEGYYYNNGFFATEDALVSAMNKSSFSSIELNLILCR